MMDLKGSHLSILELRLYLKEKKENIQKTKQ